MLLIQAEHIYEPYAHIKQFERTNKQRLIHILKSKLKRNTSKVINTYAITDPIYWTPEKYEINYTNIKNTNNNTETFKKYKK